MSTDFEAQRQERSQSGRRTQGVPNCLGWPSWQYYTNHWPHQYS